MSSEILLDEIQANIANILANPKGFLTKIDKSNLNSTIISEQVKINALRRQHELVLKLAKELPGRIETLNKDAATLRQANKELTDAKAKRKQEIGKLETHAKELQDRADSVIKQMQDMRESQALSEFRDEQLLNLISKVTDLRKRVTLAIPYPDKTEYEYLLSKLNHNEQLIVDAQFELSRALGDVFS